MRRAVPCLVRPGQVSMCGCAAGYEAVLSEGSTNSADTWSYGWALTEYNQAPVCAATCVNRTDEHCLALLDMQKSYVFACAAYVARRSTHPRGGPLCGRARCAHARRHGGRGCRRSSGAHAWAHHAQVGAAGSDGDDRADLPCGRDPPRDVLRRLVPALSDRSTTRRAWRRPPPRLLLSSGCCGRAAPWRAAASAAEPCAPSVSQVPSQDE